MTSFFLSSHLTILYLQLFEESGPRVLMKHVIFYLMKIFIMTQFCCFAYFTWHHNSSGALFRHDRLGLPL